jgi:hypothetical protein
MPKKRDINKVKAVAKIYANNGMNMMDALRKTGDNLEPVALGVKACRWRNSIEIQEELKAELSKFDKSIANDIYCIANLIEIINDKENKPSDKVNALNVLAKVIGASKEGQVQNNITFDISSLRTIPVKSMAIDTSIVSSATTTP